MRRRRAPLLLLLASTLPLAASICCCCDLHTWLADTMDDHRTQAESAAEMWLQVSPRVQKVFGRVDTTERHCLGAFPFEKQLFM